MVGEHLRNLRKDVGKGPGHFWLFCDVAAVGKDVFPAGMPVQVTYHVDFTLLSEDFYQSLACKYRRMEVFIRIFPSTI